MDKSKRSILQLSQRDLDEIADAANLHAGEGIVLSRDKNGIEVSIDKQAFRSWVLHILNGGSI